MSDFIPGSSPPEPLPPLNAARPGLAPGMPFATPTPRSAAFGRANPGGERAGPEG